MKKNWKKLLIDEIDELIGEIEDFNKKWDIDTLKKMNKKYLKIRDIDIQEKYDFIKIAREYLDSLSSNDNIFDRLRTTLSSFYDADELPDGCCVSHITKDNIQNLNIVNYLNSSDKEEIANFLIDYDQILINSHNVRKNKKYCQVCQYLIFIGADPWNFHLLDYDLLDDTFSQYCKQEFKAFCFTRELSGAQQLIENAYENSDRIPFVVCEKDNGETDKYAIFIKKDKNFLKKEHLNFPLSLKIDFLTNLKNCLKKEDYSSLVDFAICQMKDNRLKVTKDFMDLKEKYEQTPEEVMVLDQRYYAEKQIEEKREFREQQLELQKEQMEREERHKERQLRLQKEQMEREEYNRAIERRRQETLDRENREYQARQLEAQKAQARAVFDSKIAELEAEKWQTNDRIKKGAIQAKIDNLRNQRNRS